MEPGFHFAGTAVTLQRDLPPRVVPASPLAQAPLRTAPSHFTQLITVPRPRLPLSLSSLPPVESVWVAYCFSGPITFTHISVTASSSLGVAWGKEGVRTISACVHAADTQQTPAAHSTSSAIGVPNLCFQMAGEGRPLPQGNQYLGPN